MTIGQRLSAGSKMMGSTQAREAGGRISAGDHQASDLCRPFHGLAALVTFLIPALKRWAICTSSAFADDKPSTFWAALPGTLPISSRVRTERCGSVRLRNRQANLRLRFFGLRTGRLRSLARVPPAILYSALSAPCLIFTPASMFTDIVSSSFFQPLELVELTVNSRFHGVISVVLGFGGGDLRVVRSIRLKAYSIGVRPKSI